MIAFLMEINENLFVLIVNDNFIVQSVTVEVKQNKINELQLIYYEAVDHEMDCYIVKHNFADFVGNSVDNFVGLNIGLHWAEIHRDCTDFDLDKNRAVVDQANVANEFARVDIEWRIHSVIVDQVDRSCRDIKHALPQ